jgi:signal transduction histidine kinase
MGRGSRTSLLSRRGTWAAAAGFWLFVAAVSTAQIVWIAQTPGQRINVRGAIDWQIAYCVAWIPLTIGVWHVTRGWLPERFGGWLRLLIRHIPLVAIVALAHAFIVTLFAQALAVQQMPFWDRLLMQVRGQLNGQVLIYTAIAGTGAAMTLYERYQDRRVAAARLEAELAAARLQALRGHLQPHFLFNSLHSIAALARTGDTAGVVRLIAALSDLLRHVLDAGDRHASLREELQIVERYLEIQRVRFADRLEVTVDVAPDVADARVPLLVVQPLVENAVRHGLAPRVREGSVLVRAVRDDGQTRIDVEDTGVGLPPGWTPNGGTGTGLRNLASRLAAEFGDAASLDVRPREGGGVRATVRLPYTPS